MYYYFVHQKYNTYLYIFHKKYLSVQQLNPDIVFEYLLIDLQNSRVLEIGISNSR